MEPILFPLVPQNISTAIDNYATRPGNLRSFNDRLSREARRIFEDTNEYILASETVFWGERIERDYQGKPLSLFMALVTQLHKQSDKDTVMIPAKDRLNWEFKNLSKLISANRYYYFHLLHSELLAKVLLYYGPQSFQYIREITRVPEATTQSYLQNYRGPITHIVKERDDLLTLLFNYGSSLRHFENGGWWFDLPHLFRLTTNLTSLTFFSSYLKGNEFDQLFSVIPPTQLVDLNLSKCNLIHSTITSITLCTQLKTLDFSHCSLSIGILKPFLLIPSLQRLNLHRSFLNDNDVATLTTLRNLRELDISLNQVSDSSIASITSLTSLNISRTKIPQIKLIEIAKLPHLTELSAEGMSFHMTTLTYLTPLMNQLRTLKLSDNTLGYRLPGHSNDLTLLNQFSSLTQLSLAHNRLHDPDVKELSLAQLTHLDVSNNFIENLMIFSQLPSLMFLDGRGNASDTWPKNAKIFGFTSLRVLHVTSLTQRARMKSFLENRLTHCHVNVE